MISKGFRCNLYYYVYVCIFVCVFVCVFVFYSQPCGARHSELRIQILYTLRLRASTVRVLLTSSQVCIWVHKKTHTNTHTNTHTKPDRFNEGNPSSSHLALQRRESLPLGARRLWPRSVARRRARCTRVCDFAPLRQQQEQRQSGSTLHQFSSFSCSKFHLSKQKKNGRSGCSSYAGCNLRVP
jgi:hypothetical protein